MKRLGKILIISLASLFLSSCKGELVSGDDIQSKLIPNLGSFLTQLAALIVIILLVIIFGYKPIKKMVKKRQDYVENNINEANKKNQEADLKLSQSNEAVLENRRLATSILEEAKKEAEVQKEEIIRNAELEVAKMKKRAEEDIKQSEEDAKEEIRQRMVEIALDASSELLKRNVTNKDNEKLVDEFIKEIDEE